MKLEPIYTNKAPEPIGPYSQGVKVGDMIYISGQIPIDPNTGEVVSNDVELQTKQVLQNLDQVILAAGSSKEKVIKTTIYIQNMDDFSIINKVYGTYFTKNLPARACVEVSGLPKGVSVEIDAIAIV